MPMDEDAESAAREAKSDGAYDTALERLMGSYGDEIFRFCSSMLDCRDTAQDVLQVTFVQAYEAMADFEGRSSFRTWLYTIARHRCLDHLKKERRRQARIVFTDEAPESPDERCAANPDTLMARALAYCLEKLPESIREAVLLRHHAEFSYAEMAGLLRVKEGTLQARVARALPKLKKCVERWSAAR